MSFVKSFKHAQQVLLDSPEEQTHCRAHSGEQVCSCHSPQVLKSRGATAERLLPAIGGTVMFMSSPMATIINTTDLFSR